MKKRISMLLIITLCMFGIKNIAVIKSDISITNHISKSFYEIMEFTEKIEKNN